MNLANPATLAGFVFSGSAVAFTHQEPAVMPYFSSDADIERIGRGLIDRSLPKPEWTHAAHFAAAFWLLSSPDHDARREMPDFIRAYNEATGTPNTDSGGYHETITLASLRAASAWLAARPHASLHI